MSTPAYTIRPARSDDISAMREIWIEMMTFHAERDDFFRITSEGPENFSKFMKDLMQKDTACVLVAETENRIVGHCFGMVEDYPPVFLRKQYGFISDLVVTADCRRRGIGRALANQLIRWFQEEKSITVIELFAAWTNEVSRPFWESMGFRPGMIKLLKILE